MSGYIDDANAEQIRELPDAKLEEVAACAKGHLKYCPECGGLTAFVGTPTYNDSSDCHACGYTHPL